MAVTDSTRTALYETTYCVRPDTTDDARKALNEKIKSIIEAHSGSILGTEDWGRRRLAYPIKKETRAYYTYTVYTGNSSLVAELERNLRYNEQVIRFLSVQVMKEFDSTKYQYKATSNLGGALPPMTGHSGHGPGPAPHSGGGMGGAPGAGSEERTSRDSAHT